MKLLVHLLDPTEPVFPLLTCHFVISSASASYYLPAYATLLRAILTVIPVVYTSASAMHSCRPGGDGKVGPGGVAGEGAQGGPGGLLAGPDRPRPRRVLLRPRRVSRPVRRQRRRPGRHRLPGAGAGHVPGPGPGHRGAAVCAATP